jgi:DNA-binding NtrC family response regulator
MILVIEDDPGIRQMLGLALESLGHDARLADGRGPVDTADVDAVIIDLRLGERTAHELLVAQPELRARPLIVATADPRVPEQEAIPGAVVLRKPFDLETLGSVLDEALDGTATSG